MNPTHNQGTETVDEVENTTVETIKLINKLLEEDKRRRLEKKLDPHVALENADKVLTRILLEKTSKQLEDSVDGESRHRRHLAFYTGYVEEPKEP